MTALLPFRNNEVYRDFYMFLIFALYPISKEMSSKKENRTDITD